MEEERVFGVWDYVVFVLMLVISAAIGIFYGCRGGKQKTTKEYLTADHSVGIIPVAISILVSFMSAILIIGTPAEIYIDGTQYFMIMFGLVLGVFIAALVYVPLLFPLKLISSFEYLERRYNSRLVKLISIFIMIYEQVLYIGIASFAPSTALEAVTGCPIWGAIILLGAVSTFYTTLGGMKAVVWTDVFQSGIMLMGLLAILIQGVVKVGGFAEVWNQNEKWGRIKFFDFNPDPTQKYSFWSLIIGGMVAWTTVSGCSQASVQRYSALPSISSAQKSVMLNVFGIIVFYTVTCLCGIVLFAYYANKGCDPLTSKKVGNPNQLIPYFVLEILGFPGMPGLFISCLFSAALSTISSGLNALAAVTWEDFLKPCLGERLTESQKTWVTRGLVLIFGATGMGVSFVVAGLDGTVLEVSMRFLSAGAGTQLALFSIGGLFPCVNGVGAAVGGIVGLAFPLWMSIGAYNLPRRPFPLPFPTSNCTANNVTATTLATSAATLTTIITNTRRVITPDVREITGIRKLYTVSFLWYTVIGALTTSIVSIIVSFITGPTREDEVDPRYLIPLFDRLCCCLPATWRKVLRCNRDLPEQETIKKVEIDVKMIYPEKSDDINSDSPTLEKSRVVSDMSLDSGIDTTSFNDLNYGMSVSSTRL